MGIVGLLRVAPAFVTGFSASLFGKLEQFLAGNVKEFRSYFDGNGAGQTPKVRGLTIYVVESVNTRLVVAKYIIFDSE